MPLGLEVGIRQNLSHFGLPGLAMSAARNLGKAVEICLRYPKQAGGITSARVAGALQVSVRTLRRRLREKGSSYRASRRGYRNRSPQTQLVGSRR